MVLDASALLEYLGGGGCAGLVADRLGGGGLISALTQLEVLRALPGVSLGQFTVVLKGVGITVQALDARLVGEATRLQRAGAELEFAVAASLARSRGVRLVTLRAIDASFGCEVDQIRAPVAGDSPSLPAGARGRSKPARAAP